MKPENPKATRGNKLRWVKNMSVQLACPLCRPIVSRTRCGFLTSVQHLTATCPFTRRPPIPPPAVVNHPHGPSPAPALHHMHSLPALVCFSHTHLRQPPVGDRHLPPTPDPDNHALVHRTRTFSSTRLRQPSVHISVHRPHSPRQSVVDNHRLTIDSCKPMVGKL